MPNYYKDIPKVVALCGSTRFRETFLEINRKLTLEGIIVLMPGVFEHDDETPLTKEQKEKLDALHKRKIYLSDGIYVINVGGYIGKSTKSEIEYAKKEKKEIIYHE